MTITPVYTKNLTDPINLTDPTGLFWGEGVLADVGGFLMGTDCGDGGLLGAISGAISDDIGRGLDRLGNVDLRGSLHTLGTGLSFVSFIPGPLGNAAAAASAVLFAASGDWKSASTMAVVAALGYTGSYLAHGIDSGLEQTVAGLSDDVVRIRPWMAVAGKTAVYAPRYAVQVGTTDWSWLKGW
jgi:hypothetical protein